VVKTAAPPKAVDPAKIAAIQAALAKKPEAKEEPVKIHMGGAAAVAHVAHVAAAVAPSAVAPDTKKIGFMYAGELAYEAVMRPKVEKFGTFKARIAEKLGITEKLYLFVKIDHMQQAPGPGGLYPVDDDPRLVRALENNDVVYCCKRLNGRDAFPSK